MPALQARAEGILVRDAALVAAEEGYYLEADFEITLNATLEEALNKGVPLYFLLEFEMIRPRWYWLDDKLVNTQQQYRLAYNALTRQYRLGIGAFFQNFNELNEALSFLSRVRRRQVLELGMLSRGSVYSAAVRMRLDVSQLPKPFQLNALASRDWNLSSDWHRWSVKP
ncbi:MAG: DUF4390 domain-containing protein [Betaproteobacteria bacterium]|nr:DUF4390 domain-containing protein [Betaproteobacteria bacterium]